MPGKSGYEVCEAIKADPEPAHIPVLLLTGTFEAFDEARAARVGADGTSRSRSRRSRWSSSSTRGSRGPDPRPPGGPQQRRSDPEPFDSSSPRDRTAAPAGRHRAPGGEPPETPSPSTQSRSSRSSSRPRTRSTSTTRPPRAHHAAAGDRGRTPSPRRDRTADREPGTAERQALASPRNCRFGIGKRGSGSQDSYIGPHGIPSRTRSGTLGWTRPLVNHSSISFTRRAGTLALPLPGSWETWARKRRWPFRH